MDNTVILNVAEKKSCFGHALQCDKYENISVITIKKRKRALKKIFKTLPNQNILINNLIKDEYILNNCIKEYNEISYKTVFSVINKICRCTASKYGIQLPFEEIYIYAIPKIAYKIITRLMDIGRMFTIVSEEPPGKEADELYFEHGCIIRHIKKAERRNISDSVVIRVDNMVDLTFVSSPIINVAETPVLGDKVIDARSIYVFDDRLLMLCRLWGGNSSLKLYNLVGEMPPENAKVDINKTADRIFLLDMNQF